MSVIDRAQNRRGKKPASVSLFDSKKKTVDESKKADSVETKQQKLHDYISNFKSFF